MGKIWVEVCLISARGLRRTSPLWKLQWYAVGWIDPNNQYCSKIDSSGNANPVWKTKFSMLVDTSVSDLQDLALHVEVYSREPIFLREKLMGTATVVLKEFMDKYNKNPEVLKPIQEVGSFQLRKKKSNKPQGFVDISIRISEEREEPSSHTAANEGFKLADHSNGFNLANEYGPPSAYSQPQSIVSSQLPECQLQPTRQPEYQPQPTRQPEYQPQPTRQPEYQPQPTRQHGPRIQFRTQNSHQSVGGPSHLPAAGPSYPPAAGPSYPPAAGPSYPPAAGPSYQPPRTPPPPPPPSNVGYIPTFLPRTDNMPPSYLNIPQTGAAAATRGARPGFGMGLGAGALAAGAMIFGDDFLSGFDVPRGLQDPSLTISLDPPF